MAQYALLAGLVFLVTHLPDTLWSLYWLVWKFLPADLVIDWKDCLRHLISLNVNRQWRREVHRSQVNPCDFETNRYFSLEP